MIMTETAYGSDETEIRALIAARATATRERDADALVAGLTPEAVTFDLDPPLLHTSAEVHDPDRLRTWFAGFEGPIHRDVRDLTLVIGGDVAFGYGLTRLAAVPLGAPEGFQMWFRSTWGLRKVDGMWKIAHEHSSTPFAMDGSFLAMTDLQP